ncbi:MAG: hypothetical protein IK073_00225 [Paludibacteraceae bacterium]|nr:hypothetical protein [Paludibacteraceae bacterium]
MKNKVIFLFALLFVSVMGWAQEQAVVKVLSINNSLIDYNDQYLMFNNIATTMGKNATWTKHTNLGKTLAYHYNEDPLVPNAQTVVANEAWTHIILQEQSSLPRTNFAQFRTNVQTWVNYIRTNCPNPNAVIILPINWAFSNDASYQANNRTLIANFRLVAEEFGLTLCPVAIAYGNYQVDHPSTIAADLYTDDRHPTQAATYLAACLEYAVIFGENPSTITWKPAALSETMAETMRSYAQEAYEGVERTEPLPVEPTPAVSITGSTYTENFDTIGGEDVTEAQIAASQDGKRSFDRATQLPVGWRVDNNTSAVRSVRSFAAASETTMYIGGQNLPSNARNGTWNFGLTGSTDRAVGGITSSIDGGARTVSVMVHLHNDAGAAIDTLTLSYDIEKYRNGANTAGFTHQLYVSADGENWTSAGSTFCRQFAKDANTNGAEVVPISVTAVSGQLACTFPENGDLYLAWSVSPISGSDCAKSMAFGIDNVVIVPIMGESTGVEALTDNRSPLTVTKVLRDGQMVIVRGEEEFNAQGTRIK